MDVVLTTVREFSTIDQQEKALAKRKKELRDRLAALVELEGVPDEKGHLLFPLPVECGDILSLQMQRKVSRSLDGERAEEMLKGIPTEDGQTLWDRCVEYVAMLDEDKVMAAHYDGLLSEEQVDELYPESVSFAFSPIRKGRRR